MALISNNISGSASNNSRIGVTGSVVFANVPGSKFPSQPGSDSVFFVSGNISSKPSTAPDYTKQGTAVFGGDVVISGTLFGSSPLYVGNNLIITSNQISGSAGGNITLKSAGGVSVPGTLTLESPGMTDVGSAQLYINGTTSGRIDWNTIGTGAPTTTTRSAGTKINLYPAISSTQTDYAIGIETSTMWHSVPSSTRAFKWYAGTTEIMNLSGTSNLYLKAYTSTSTLNTILLKWGRNTTTTAANQELYLNGSSGSRFTLSTDQHCKFTIDVVGVSITTGDTYWCQLQGAAKNVGGTVSLVGGVMKTADYDSGASTFNADAVIASGAIVIYVDPPSAVATDVQWSASGLMTLVQF